MDVPSTYAYGFKIEHRSEKLHGNADDLRRAPWNKCKVNNCVDVDHVSSVKIDD